MNTDTIAYVAKRFEVYLADQVSPGVYECVTPNTSFLLLTNPGKSTVADTMYHALKHDFRVLFDGTQYGQKINFATDARANTTLREYAHKNRPVFYLRELERKIREKSATVNYVTSFGYLDVNRLPKIGHSLVSTQFTPVQYKRDLSAKPDFVADLEDSKTEFILKNTQLHIPSAQEVVYFADKTLKKKQASVLSIAA